MLNLKIEVGDTVLSSDTDVLFKKKVKQEWWVVESISPCGSAFRCRAKADGFKGILYTDEIIMKEVKNVS